MGFADLLNLDILKIAVSIDCNCPSDKTIQDYRFDLKVTQKIVKLGKLGLFARTCNPSKWEADI